MSCGDFIMTPFVWGTDMPVTDIMLFLVVYLVIAFGIANIKDM